MSLDSKKFAPKVVEVDMQSPWVTIYNKFKAMFSNDIDLKISELEGPDNKVATFEITSTNTDKINALSNILNDYFILGNVKLAVKFGVINGSNVEFINTKKRRNHIDQDIIFTAFENNNALDDVRTIKFPGGFPVTYILFVKEVVQFYNDDMTDLYGNYNGLYEDIARDIFLPFNGTFYCTAVE